jgi:hypothetical protein
VTNKPSNWPPQPHRSARPPEDERLQQWWDELDEAVRQQLLALDLDLPITPEIAALLRRFPPFGGAFSVGWEGEPDWTATYASRRVRDFVAAKRDKP